MRSVMEMPQHAGPARPCVADVVMTNPAERKIPDIVTAAKGLTAAGVKFELYPGMEQDELGTRTSPGGGKIALVQGP